MSDLTVREYRAGDEHEIAKLYALCFGRDRPIEEFRWRFFEAPVERVDILVLCAGGRVVGSSARAGFPAFVNGRRAVCRVTGDAMVHPDFRGRQGLAMLTEAGTDLPYDLSLYTPNEGSIKVVARLGRRRFRTPITQWVRWGGLPIRIASTVVPRRRLRVTPLAELGTEVDALAKTAATFAPCIRIRDARYLRWRWLEQPHTEWEIWGTRDGSRLTGIVVFGIDRRHDPGWHGRIVDVLAADAASLRAQLLVAGSVLGRRGCRIVSFDYSDPRPWSRRAPYLAGFLRRGEGPVFSGRGQQAWTQPWADRFESWYLTRGDSDLC